MWVIGWGIRIEGFSAEAFNSQKGLVMTQVATMVRVRGCQDGAINQGDPIRR